MLPSLCFLGHLDPVLGLYWANRREVCMLRAKGSLFLSMMVNLMDQLDCDVRCPDIWLNFISGCSWEVFCIYELLDCTKQVPPLSPVLWVLFFDLYLTSSRSWNFSASMLAGANTWESILGCTDLPWLKIIDNFFHCTMVCTWDALKRHESLNISVLIFSWADERSKIPL